MDNKKFVALRHYLQKTQKQMAELLGVSLKAIQSFEQGWRNIPVHVERQILFLLAMKRAGEKVSANCWKIKKCPAQQRKSCPAWEFHSGQLCWFINGTICQGKPAGSWQKKIKICQKCPVFKEALNI